MKRDNQKLYNNNKTQTKKRLVHLQMISVKLLVKATDCLMLLSLTGVAEKA